MNEITRSVIVWLWVNRTVYYGEYKSYGAGAGPSGRVKWSRNLTPKEAAPFLTLDIIGGRTWIRSARKRSNEIYPIIYHFRFPLGIPGNWCARTSLQVNRSLLTIFLSEFILEKGNSQMLIHLDFKVHFIYSMNELFISVCRLYNSSTHKLFLLMN